MDITTLYYKKKSIESLEKTASQNKTSAIDMQKTGDLVLANNHTEDRFNEAKVYFNLAIDFYNVALYDYMKAYACAYELDNLVDKASYMAECVECKKGIEVLNRAVRFCDDTLKARHEDFLKTK